MCLCFVLCCAVLSSLAPGNLWLLLFGGSCDDLFNQYSTEQTEHTLSNWLSPKANRFWRDCHWNENFRWLPLHFSPNLHKKFEFGAPHMVHAQTSWAHKSLQDKAEPRKPSARTKYCKERRVWAAAICLWSRHRMSWGRRTILCIASTKQTIVPHKMSFKCARRLHRVLAFDIRHIVIANLLHTTLFTLQRSRMKDDTRPHFGLLTAGTNEGCPM